MKLSEFIPLRPRSGKTSLLATVAVPAGEAIEIAAELERVDLNEELTNGNDGVFLTRVSGDSMEAEIFHGDLLVINRNLQPNAGDIVVARVGEPFNREIFDNCRSRAENLREQIKSLKSKHNLVQGGVSFPKDLILIEGSEIEYDVEGNRFLFDN